MPEVLKREHAFISYSHKDEIFARKVRNDLEAVGVATWMDDKLEPGTPIWEQAIRDAMKGSLAVVLIASPYAKEGPYVRGELHLAESRQLEILPLWMEGETWIECVPLSLSDTQYIDGRHARYATGVDQLVKKLHQIIEDRSPKHCLLTKASNEAYRPLIESYRTTYYYATMCDMAFLRDDYIYIELSGGDIVAMRYTAYESFRELSDDLYMAYLKDHYDYRPFTYGNQWLLGTHACFYGSLIQLLVPWCWLSLPKNCSLADEYLDWSAFSPQTWFASRHLHYLQVLDKLPPLAFGLATVTSRAAQSFLLGKEGYMLMSDLPEIMRNKSPYVFPWLGYTTVTLAERPEAVNPRDYHHHFIMTLYSTRSSRNHVSPGEVTRVACTIQDR